jgi:hypothetical protein
VVMAGEEKVMGSYLRGLEGEAEEVQKCSLGIEEQRQPWQTAEKGWEAAGPGGSLSPSTETAEGTCRLNC